MVSNFVNFGASLLAGVFAPLGAVCVLPLYPGFLSYLASQTDSDNKKSFVVFGWLIALGILISMFVFGLIFSKILESSLTNAIGIVSPIAFGILGIISLLMIFNIDLSKIVPKASTPILKNPYLSSIVFGLFFGAVVLPCNPAALIILFTISFSTSDFLINLVNFTLFGVGMALPLIIFAYISEKSNSVINWLTRNKKGINLIVGLIMLTVSVYYLFFVFKIFGGFS